MFSQSPHDAINVYDERGNVIAVKPRSFVDPVKDILPVVFVFLKNAKDEFLLATISQDPYHSRGANVGKIGFPAATFVRKDETEEQAALRSLRVDLGLASRPARFGFLGKKFYRFHDGTARFVSAYLCRHDGPFDLHPYAASGLQWRKREDLAFLLTERMDAFSPAFVELYKEYLV